MNKFDLDILNCRIHILYNFLQANIKDIERINVLLDNISAKYMSEDKELGFMLLFSFDNFHVTHEYLVSCFSPGDEIKTELLLNIMQNK